MNIDLKGYGEKVATFAADSAVEKGSLVKLTSDFKVSRCVAGDKIFGVCIDARGGYATVQTAGYVELPANQKLNIGYTQLAPAGNTSVTSSNSGTYYWVVTSTATSVGFIL